MPQRSEAGDPRVAPGVSVASRRPRVLHIGKFYPPHMGGIETHLQALCREIRPRVDPEVLVANDDRPTREEVQEGIAITRAGRLLDIASAPVAPAMVRHIRASSADLVHLHLPNPWGVLAYLLSGRRGPLLVTYHSDIVRQKALGSAFEPILKRLLDRSAAVIATSRSLAESSPVLAAYPDRCRIVPYGISVERFQRYDRSQPSRLREQYGPSIVIAVGRLIYYKGFEHLIRAMAQVPGRLLIVGDGPLRGALEEEARVAGVTSRVVFLGEIQNDDIVPYYHAADLFVLPSVARSEAFGIVQLEAMACGKPVVNTSLPSGVPWVSPHGVTGLTVPPADPQALADAINLLLADPGRRRAYGEAAAARVRDEFRVELMGLRTLEIYEDVLRLPAGSLADSPSEPSGSRGCREKMMDGV